MWSSVFQNNVRPSLEDCFWDMQAPTNGTQEETLVAVNLHCSQSRHLAPRLRRVVAVLQILGGQDEGSQEHASATLHGAQRRTVDRLLHGSIMRWDMGSDEHEVVQSNLQRRIAVRERLSVSSIYLRRGRIPRPLAFCCVHGEPESGHIASTIAVAESR